MSILKTTNSGKYSKPIRIEWLLNDLGLRPMQFDTGKNLSTGKQVRNSSGQFALNYDRYNAGQLIQLYDNVWSWWYKIDGHPFGKRLYCQEDARKVVDYWKSDELLNRRKLLIELLEELEPYGDEDIRDIRKKKE